MVLSLLLVYGWKLGGIEANLMC